MLNASTNQSANRVGSTLHNMSSTANHRKPIRNLFKSSRSAKKQHSLALNKADFEMCPSPDENQMLESMNNSPDTYEQNNTNQSDSTTSDDTITDRQPQQPLSTSSTSPDRHRFISSLKHRLALHRHDSNKHTGNDQEKNHGYLLIDHVDSDLVLIPTDNSDAQHTRHAEPCEHGQIDEDIVDINEVHLEPTTPVTPHLLPPTSSSVSNSILPVINHSHSESDVLATQAGVECETPAVFQGVNSHETQPSPSTTNSSSSTNSSNNDTHPHAIDRTILTDLDYVLEQKRDLERITVYEIALIDDRRDYQQDLPQNERDELDFNLRYAEAVQLNDKLKEELKRLQEEKSRIHSPWSCEVCTFINDPYIKTGRDVCEMCEGPSPLKRHTLTS